ncbi:MAG: hypothetical protein NC489_10725 [Ruminococcus flavefaciens]|nr:hypothetical protein [Ruminococcus flavefaciens]
MFEEECDRNHEFHYDVHKTLTENEALRETKTIIAIIFRDYWATTEQREAILKQQEKDRMKLKIERYGKMLDDEECD